MNKERAIPTGMVLFVCKILSVTIVLARWWGKSMKAIMRDTAELKDSGVGYLGYIPQNWQLASAKFFVSISNGSDPKTDGEIPVYGSGKGSFRTCGESKDGPTVLLGRKGTVDIPQYIEGKYWNVDTAFDVKAKYGYSLRFFYYLSTCFDYKRYSTQTALPSMTQSNYNSMRIVVPSFSEQNSIYEYLDVRCSKIDAIIAEAKASIEEYKELKQAVIYEAVTKGLDKNVSMKDSCIEWIGKIPKQWKIARLGRGLEFIQTGPFGSQLHSDEYIEDGIPVVNPANIKNLEIKIDNKCTLSTEKANELQQHIMTPHEIVFGRRGEMGRCACVPDDGKTYFCGTGCIRMRCNNLLYSNYLILFLSSETAKQYYELNSVGTTMSNLNSEIISATPTLYPPIDEQRNIVSHINEIVPKYDNLIIEKQSLIADLEAYKKSLIYEVVTGKRKVVA